MNQYTPPNTLRGTTGPAGEDPLSELARIVGRDRRADPFDTLLDDARAAGGEAEQADPAWFDESELYADPDEGGQAPDAEEYLADDFYADGTAEPAADMAPRRRGWGAMGMAAVVVVAVAGAGAGYAWKAGLLSHVAMPAFGGAIPVISARTDPVKVTPPVAQASLDAGTREIFQRPGQVATVPEHVVAREEQPVSIEAATPTPAPAVQAAPAGARPTGAPPEPRRVKTVKVLSDGTVVTGETVAPANTLPTGLPAAFADEGAPVHTVRAMADPIPSMPVPDMGPAAPAQTPQTVASLPAPVLATQPDAVAPAMDDTPPAPKPRAADRKPRVKPATTQVASLDPVVPAAPAPSGGFVVQIASQKSQADANATFHKLQAHYSGVLGGMSANIRSADLGSRGTFYRVRVGPMASRDAATALCVKLKAAGGSCVVSRN